MDVPAEISRRPEVSHPRHVLEDVQQLLRSLFHQDLHESIAILVARPPIDGISIVPAAPRFMSTALAMYRSGVPIVWALAETASAVATTSAAAAAEARQSSRGTC